MNWLLAEAKNKFSEVVRLALAEGPQRVQRRHDAVIVLDEREFNRLRGASSGFKAFLCAGPSFAGLDLERDTSGMREETL